MVFIEKILCEETEEVDSLSDQVILGGTLKSVCDPQIQSISSQVQEANISIESNQKSGIETFFQ
jgi:hypothetical protein